MGTAVLKGRKHYNGTDIAEEVATELKLPYAQVRKVQDKVFEIIMKRIYEYPISIHGFGRLETITTKPKKVRNLKDGTSFVQPPQKRLRLRKDPL